MRDLHFVNETEWDAFDLRRLLEVYGEGVIGLAGGALRVTAGAAGLSVDVAAGVGFVQGDAIADQGRYRVALTVGQNSAAFLDGGIQPAHAVNPRVDRIIARVYDDEADNSTQTAFRLEVLTGVATAGATLVNETGAAALPGSAMLLANVLVPANAAAILAENVEDQRTDALAGLIGGGVDIGHTIHDEGVALPDETILDFQGAGVTATDAVGRTVVTIPGPGPAYSLTVAKGALVIPGVDDITLVGDVDLTDQGAGAVTITVGVGSLPSRATVTVVTAALADLATEDLLFALAPSFRLLRVQTDAAARVRLYATAADRTADASRPVGTDPTADHGVILDHVTTVGDLDWRLSPIVDGSSMDAPPVANIAAAITNRSGAARTISVTLTFVPTEA